MTTIRLGRLEPVDLRLIWRSESQDFTPWLAIPENLKLLGDAIGMELELEAQEKDVGPFRADILCKDTSNDTWVLIENQLQSTDHVHLGQLMTYAAGLKAVVIVWIAQRFTEEHRAALDWLNEITDDRFRFFGLEVELWKIGPSDVVAPKFNVVCKPNTWTESVAEGRIQIERGELSDAKKLQLEFWTSFRDFVKANSKVIKATKPHPQHWMTFAIGRSGIYMHAIASMFDSTTGSYDSHELRAELVIATDEAKQHFQLLAEVKDAIQREAGEQFTWHNEPDKHSCKIYLRRPAEIDDRSRWGEYHEWLLRKLELIHKIFSARVKQLPAGMLIAPDNGDAAPAESSM